MPDLDPALLTMATDYVTRIVGVVVALFIALIVAGWLRRLVLRASERAEVDATLAKLFAHAARHGLLTMAVIACLGIFGIETTSFAAVIGAAGLAIGLAFQGSPSNLASGVMLSMFPPLLRHPPGVLGSVSIAWKVRVRTKTVDYRVLRETLTRALKTKLDAAGIGIPFPQMDVHLDPQVVEAMKRSA
jgi:small-conductance mechanosensitive channel